MAYYINLFSPATYQAFLDNKEFVSGFRENKKAIVEQIKRGDKFVCYLTKISRFAGILEVVSEPFIDRTPIFEPVDDPYILRFKVKPIVLLPLDLTIPVYNDVIWKQLSFTKELEKGSMSWTGAIRSTLKILQEEDGRLLERVLLDQSKKRTEYSFTETEKRNIRASKVKNQNSKEIFVTIPDKDAEDERIPEPSIRESLKIQALIARIGERMGFKIWLPKSDRSRVSELWTPQSGYLLDSLPLNYDDSTLKTIENIDVIWIRQKSIVRAFEVEHTTSIYSGILRMADLMAMQPNLNIKAHLVAPTERKAKIFDEILRPVFALLEKGPLAEYCTFLSYDSIKEISNERKLEHMSDTILEDYEEYAKEGEY